MGKSFGAENEKNWFVYLLRCADQTLYTGITTDLERRLAEHNAGKPRGANYTHPRRPVTLAYQEPHPTRATASQREYRIRKLNKADKERLILKGARGGG